MNEMTNSKIKSLYLDKELEVLAYPAVENPNLMIISHESLKNILFNVLTNDFPQLTVKHEEVLEIQKEFGPSPGIGHYVYSCKIWDISGRCVKELGEVLPDTQETDIARKYPALMAFQRAMDRAVISYLQLPGKAYSTEEGIPYDKSGTVNLPKVNASNSTSNSIPATIPKSTKQDKNRTGQNPTNTSTSATSAGTNATSVGAKNATGAVATNISKEGSVHTTPTLNKGGSSKGNSKKEFVKYPGENVHLNLNKYFDKDNPKTIEQVWEIDPSYVEWVATQFAPSTKEAKIIVNACRNCMTYYKGGKNVE